jgi:hypothetical protein
VKYLDANGRTVIKLERWPIVDVHDTMAFLFQEGKIHIPESALLGYWQQSKDVGEEWAQEVSDEEMSHLIPIGIYGDSARVDTAFGYEHILAFFANIVLWRPRSVRWSRFLICAISEERLTSATIPAILRRICWSANHAFYGYFPTVGHLGEPLSGAALKRAGQPLTSNLLKFQVTELRGDWSFHKKIFRFYKTQWNGREICHQCTAKGISNCWEEMYYNIETNNHMDFSLAQFLARKMPARQI